MGYTYIPKVVYIAIHFTIFNKTSWTYSISPALSGSWVALSAALIRREGEKNTTYLISYKNFNGF